MSKVIEKLLSGRFIATVAVVLSYCFIVVFTTVSYARSLVYSIEKMEAFAVGLVMGFSGTAAIIIKSYFDRADRTNENEKS